MKGRGHYRLIVINIFLLLVAIAVRPSQGAEPGLAATYRFLVGDRDKEGGILYTATSGRLQGRQLPLSFVDSADYWGQYVCRLPGNDCRVTDHYSPQNYSLTPEKSPAGDLQTERINTHNGINIYDAATWQIAVMLGQVLNHFPLPSGQNAYHLVSNQNLYLHIGHSGDASQPVANGNRALTVGTLFSYNGQAITDPRQAYTFRMLPRNWLSVDPFVGTSHAGMIKTVDLPMGSEDYQPGRVSWTDWKPITGENAWAFLIGPLQAAYLHYIIDQQLACIPGHDLAIGNALAILPAFAAMQSPSGAVYYAPAGTAGNQGEVKVDPYEVAVENTISLYAGLKILTACLTATLANDDSLSSTDRDLMTKALQLSEVMIKGGALSGNRHTAGLLSFFRKHAWLDGRFVQGGRADVPGASSPWQPNRQIEAVDVNTWGIAALGPAQIDNWFGFGAAYRNWQQVKQWGGYGHDRRLWGVGFSDKDGNGIDEVGRYRPGILSVEWTAGAITLLRSMIGHYRTIPPTSPQFKAAQGFCVNLGEDEQAMVAALATLRTDTYEQVTFPGQPANYRQLLPIGVTRPYLYASRRYLIPFGWFANPLPSTCATAWMIMVANNFNPLVYGGKY